MDPRWHGLSTHILQGYFTGTGAIIWLPQCQWSNPEGYGYNRPVKTPVEHNNGRTVVILFWMNSNYCHMILLITAVVAANQSIITFLQQAGSQPNDGLVRWGMCNLYVPQHPRNWVQGRTGKSHDRPVVGLYCMSSNIYTMWNIYI